MEYFSSDMVETPAMNTYNSLFNFNNEERDSLFDIFHLYPVFDPHSLEETAYHGQHERQSDSNCRHWLSEYDSCPGGYWGDYLFQVGRDDDGCIDTMANKEDYVQNEDQHQSSTSYNHEDGFSRSDCDYNPWCYHQYREEEEEEEEGDSYYNYGEEQRTTNGYRIDEMGLCDGIFGYFPCLLQEQNEYNNMQ